MEKKGSEEWTEKVRKEQLREARVLLCFGSKTEGPGEAEQGWGEGGGGSVAGGKVRATPL